MTAIPLDDTIAAQVGILSALIAQVRHGDDCTSSDLADRLVRTGQVHVGPTRPQDSRGLAGVVWDVLAEHVSAHDNAKAAFLEWWSTNRQNAFTLPTWDMGDLTFIGGADLWAIAHRAPTASRHQHRIAEANRTLAVIRRAHLASNAPADEHVTADDVLLAWHDSTCPESDECRSRDLHAKSVMVASTLYATLHRLGITVG